MKNNDPRKLSTEVQQQIRYQVIRLKKQGRTHEEISEIANVHRSTSSEWWNLYKREGKKALKIKKPDWALAALAMMAITAPVPFTVSIRIKGI